MHVPGDQNTHARTNSKEIVRIDQFFHKIGGGGGGGGDQHVHDSSCHTIKGERQKVN